MTPGYSCVIRHIPSKKPTNRWNFHAKRARVFGKHYRRRRLACATLAIEAEKLPKEIVAALEGSEAGAFYSVRVEKMSAEDTASFLEMRAKVQEGIADIESGDVLDASDVHAELEKKFVIVIRG
jgi:hypothetical protein